MKLIDREVLKPSIFGMFDGLTSLLGVLIPLLSFTHLLVFTTCIGLAVSSAISMGLGEYLSSDKSIPKRTRVHAATYMGIFTAIGCFVPVIPFAFTGGVLALWLAVAIYICMTFVVAFMKKEDLGWKRALVQTFVVSLIAVALVVCATLALPAPTA